VVTKACQAALITLALAASCGRPGNAEKTDDVPPSSDASPAPVAVAALAPSTSIAFEMLRTTAPAPVGCSKPSTPLALVALPSNFELGGDLSRWPVEALLWADPANDSSPHLNIGRVFAGLRSQEFLVAVETQVQSTGGQLIFEFGGLRAKDGNLEAQVVRQFRVIEGKLEEHDGGDWTPVNSEFGQVVATPAGGGRPASTEVRLGLRMVADIMNWPVWWIRVSTRPAALPALGEGHGGDTTSSRHFAGRLSSDEDRFRLTACSGWGNEQLPFSVTEVTDRRFNAGDETPPALWDYNSFGLVRRAFDSVVTLLGYRDLGIDHLTIVASLKLGDLSAGYSPTSGDTARFGYVFTESRRLAGSSTDTTASENIFASASMQLLRIYAASSGYGAPAWLQEAFAMALFNHVADANLGRLFALNRYRDQVSAFRDHLESDAALREASVRRTDKAIAFGHLLWANFDAVTLVSAWSHAITKFEGSNTPDAEFRAALVAAANLSYPGRHNETLLQRIWAGWVTPESYDPMFGPSALGDQDGDGLADFLENSHGFSAVRADTDLDGWTDLVAYVRANAALIPPPDRELIVADGSFDDWTRLLPQRVNLHRGQSGSCPEPANITHFSALTDTSGILIGAIADQFPASGQVHWEAFIDLPEAKRQLLLTTDAVGTNLIVSDAVTKKPIKIYQHPRFQGVATLEWAFRFDDIKVDPNLVKMSQKNAVSIRLRTVYQADGKESYCDETDWFESNVVL